MLIGFVSAIALLVKSASRSDPLTGGELIGGSLFGMAVGGVIGAVVGVARGTTTRGKT